MTAIRVFQKKDAGIAIHNYGGPQTFAAAIDLVTRESRAVLRQAPGR